MRRYLSPIIFILFVGCGGGNSNEDYTSSLKARSWAYQLQNATLEEIVEADFDLVVMDYSRGGSEEGEYSFQEIETIKTSGVIPIAYLSIGEAEDYRFYWNETWDTNPPDWLGEENPEWKGNYAVKYWDPEWKEIVFSYIDRIANQGFSGLYLDKVDEFEYWAEEESLTENETAQEMVKFIEEIADYCRRKIKNCYIIPQNGERLLEFDNKGALVSVVSGWAVEDLFYNGTEPATEDEINERTYYLDRVQSKGKPIFSVDYVDDGSGYAGENLQRIRDYLKKAREKGYIPYAARSDRNLDELVILPETVWESDN